MHYYYYTILTFNGRDHKMDVQASVMGKNDESEDIQINGWELSMRVNILELFTRTWLQHLTLFIVFCCPNWGFMDVKDHIMICHMTTVSLWPSAKSFVSWWPFWLVHSVSWCASRIHFRSYTFCSVYQWPAYCCQIFHLGFVCWWCGDEM